MNLDSWGSRGRIKEWCPMGVAARLKQYKTTELVDQLIARARDPMIITQADGRIVCVNSQAEKLFGYSQAELLGQKPDMLMPRPRTKRRAKERAGHVTNSR